MSNPSTDVPLTSIEPAMAGPTSDRSLLERFIQERDQTAFACVIRRHGPLVQGVCNRVLHHVQDVEDAFQATFLVLVRKAATLDLEQPLAGWLYTVAYQVALDARRSAAARAQREKQHAMNRTTSDHGDPAVQTELRQLLDRELSSFPDKYRLPVVLCYLQGLSHEEAARQLGCKAGAVKVQLARARDMLRDRLARRGLALSVGLLAGQLAEQAQAAALEPAIVDATVKLAVNFAQGAIPNGPGASAANLADGVLENMKAPSSPRPSKPARPQAARKPIQQGGQSPSAPTVSPTVSLIKTALALSAGAACLLVLAIVAVKLMDRPNKKGAGVDPALVSLRTVQQEWWDAENMANGCPDAAGALARLQDKQREWWANAGLTGKADEPAGSETLARLEELQRSWWEREGLTRGQPVRDPGALDRLNDVNQQWWDRDQIARAEPATEATPASATPQAVLYDLDVELLDKQGTRRFLEGGGTAESEEAVQFGLQWLAAQQQPDGRWLIGKNPGTANWTNRSSDITTTALALLPFLARGETHKGTSENHQYSKPVEYGLRFLLSQQKPDGSLMGTGTGMYTHALATIALCEAFNMTADPMLREPCQKAIDYIIRSQSSVYGGWRYSGPGQNDSDLSVTSWVLMALKSGQLAGLQIPRETLEKVAGFVQKLETPDGGYRYHVREPSGHTVPYPATISSIGLLCRQYLQNLNSTGGGDDQRAPPMTRGIDILLANPPVIHEGQKGIRFPVVQRQRYTNYYYWYYATYVMANVGGEPWKQWNPPMRDLLVRLQNKGQQDPALKGSWDPEGAQLLEVAGRTGVTALALLTLEVYYRHLPLNRPELGEMNKDLNSTKAPKK